MAKLTIKVQKANKNQNHIKPINVNESTVFDANNDVKVNFFTQIDG
jgi:hypothetical protein